VGVFRLFLAMAVVFGHSSHPGGWFLTGPARVQAFFVISGFYMALILDGKYNNTALFYQNRFLRLFPGYFLMVFLAIVTLIVTGRGGYYGSARDFIDALTSGYPEPALSIIFMNLAILGQEISLFFFVDSGHLQFTPDMQPFNQLLVTYLLIPQAWSISLEIYFYLLAPFLIRCSTKTLIAMMVAGICLRIILSFLECPIDPWQNRFFPTSIVFFLAGLLSYRLYGRLGSLWTSQWIGWGAFVLLPGFVATFRQWDFPGNTTLFLVAVPFFIPAIFSVTKNLSLDRFIGNLSYPVYLNHFLVLQWTKELAGEDGQLPFLIVNIVVLVLALLMHTMIERPLDRWRQTRLQPTRPLGAVDVSADGRWPAVTRPVAE
jgi:peptidoglycan/LPS O-acetylase OafA/YrhL